MCAENKGGMGVRRDTGRAQPLLTCMKSVMMWDAAKNRSASGSFRAHLGMVILVGSVRGSEDCHAGEKFRDWRRVLPWAWSTFHLSYVDFQGNISMGSIHAKQALVSCTKVAR